MHGGDDRFLGGPGKNVDVVAFRGGGFDSVMYLGVIQAWLLLKRPPPSLVTGVSAGAVAAAAMAEVYEAGAGRIDRRARQEQARRLRELVLACAGAPRELLQAWLPDTYEVSADRPLVPLKLPTQFKRERAERDTAVLSKFGLIKLFNTILAVDLDVSVITRLVRHALELSRLKEEPRWLQRWLGRLKTAASVWTIGNVHPFSFSLLLRTFFGAISGTRHDTTGHTAAELLSTVRRAWRRTIAATGRVLALIGFIGLWILPPMALAVTATSLVIYRVTTGAFAGWMDDWRWMEWAAAIDLVSFAVTATIVFGVVHTVGSVGEKILQRFDLDAELGSSYDLEQFFVRHFDPSFYGTLDVGTAVDRALRRATEAQDEARSPKTLGDYHDRARIAVAPAVADLGTGQLRLLGAKVSVVEALMAAMAVAPFFRARTLETGGPEDYKHTFVDGVNVANEPISALMNHLRKHLHEASANVTVYTVAAFPSGGLDRTTDDYSELMSVVERVQEIQSVETAELERAVTSVYSRLLPSTAVTFLPKDDGRTLTLVNARLQPIDAENRLDVNRQLLGAPNQAARARIVFRSAAAGCRATLSEAIGARLPRVAGSNGSIKCRWALNQVLPGPVDDRALCLSAAAADAGPGLAEICQECSISVNGASGLIEEQMSLRVPAVTTRPVKTSGEEGPATPWITMALSGGVFRGVFQLGVLNALSELNVRPRLFAGSSVGSIMASFGARLTRTTELEKRRTIVREAADTFLSLDLLIPTDRFADFIRRFTLRAGASEFSARDADLLFRRYDFEGRRFSRTARGVIAGLERLFYVTPFEVRALTEALRQEEWLQATRLGKRYLQDFLERSGIGLELLGAEPLKLLIEHLVLREASLGKKSTLEAFKPASLIVTATNLNAGRLKVFGMGASDSVGESPASVNLMEALLASSAFPGVFRPRSHAEVTPYQTSGEWLVDGGVTDNLPLHAAAQFLWRASDARRAKRRPAVNGRAVPHLLLTASLEPKWAALTDTQAEQVGHSWTKVRERTAQLRWNRKSDSFAKSQRDIRDIWESGVGRRDWTPLDLEVITIKPEWLPPTFGFHPMLGFRRAKQAASIAHGCASTMGKLAHIAELGPGWSASDWKFDVSDVLPSAVEWNPNHLRGAAWTREPVLTPVQTLTEADGDPTLTGRCWFRRRTRCPFFAAGDDGIGAQERHAIYVACGDERTHQPPS